MGSGQFRDEVYSWRAGPASARDTALTTSAERLLGKRGGRRGSPAAIRRSLVPKVPLGTLLPRRRGEKIPLRIAVSESRIEASFSRNGGSGFRNGGSRSRKRRFCSRNRRSGSRNDRSESRNARFVSRNNT